MFLRDFECAADIAYRLADICCYRQEHLPTGSPLSGRIAFFAARQMFNEVAAVAVAAGAECKPTVHVDGITVSGFGATTSLLGEVRKAVHGHGLKTKQRKSKTYAAGSPKPVTGAVIVGAELRLPNERHRKIWQTRQDLLRAQGPERVRVQRVLRGRLQEAKQILGREALQVGVGVGAGDGSEIKRAAFLDHQATEA